MWSLTQNKIGSLFFSLIIIFAIIDKLTLGFLYLIPKEKKPQTKKFSPQLYVLNGHLYYFQIIIYLVLSAEDKKNLLSKLFIVAIREVKWLACGYAAMKGWSQDLN